MATPNAFEQLTLELINQARLNPHGEYDRLVTNAPQRVLDAIAFFNVDLVLLKQQFDALVAVAPLAWNEALGDAAQTHTQLMQDFDNQSHNLPGEPGLGARITAAGYTWNRVGENIFAFAEDAFHAHAGFFIDWGNTPTGIQTPPGHRNSIMRANFHEVGIGHVVDNNPATGVGPNLVTHNFGGVNSYTSQVVGVIFDDADGDRFYDIGEGLGGATITSGATVANGFTTGGFNLDLVEGTHTLVFNSALGAASITVTLGADNIKVDMFDPGAFRSSVTATLGAGGLSLQLLGEAAINATGNAGANLLIGNVGDNILDGAGGADTAFFTGARADYTVAAVAGGATVVDNRAGSPDGADTILNVETVSFNGVLFALTDLIGAPVSTTPTTGDDTLTGTPGRDTIDGLAGNDTIFGLADIDTLIGGPGNDTLDGGANPQTGPGAGGDVMLGGPGNDIYFVDSAFDYIDEGGGGTTQVGGAGDVDTINSSAYFYWDFFSVAEVLNLVEGSSTIDITTGLDIGLSTIVGGGGDNTLNGNSGNNNIYANWGNDTVRARGGIDHIDFTDRGAGATGANTLIFEPGNGYDIVWNFLPGADTLDVSAFGLTGLAQLQTVGFNDGIGNSFYALGDGTDYLYIIGQTLATVSAADFIF